MKKIKFALFALAFVAFGCSDDKKTAAAPAQPLPVAAFTAQSSDVPVSLEFNGQTSSDKDVILRAKVTGAIERQLFKAGASVKIGDPLFEIDYKKYKAAYDAALASFQSAKANYDRALKLKAGAAISQREFDATKAEFSAAKASLASAKIEFDNSIVRAPFSGVIGDAMQDIGDYVSLGTDLARLTELKPMYVKFAISDKQRINLAQNLDNGQWERKHPDAHINVNGAEFVGKVVFLDNVLDSSTASANAKAKFDNNESKLRPGVYTKIKISGFYQKNGFRVPQIAVLQDLANPFVYVVDNGKVAKRVVRVVAQDTSTSTLAEGLKDGDKIILDNFQKLRVGVPVQIVEEKGLDEYLPKTPIDTKNPYDLD